MDLEVFAEGDEDVFAYLEVFGGCDFEVVQGEGDGEVETVVGGFVDDNEGVFLNREFRKIDMIFWRGYQIA